MIRIGRTSPSATLARRRGELLLREGGRLRLQVSLTSAANFDRVDAVLQPHADERRLVGHLQRRLRLLPALTNTVCAATKSPPSEIPTTVQFVPPAEITSLNVERHTADASAASMITSLVARRLLPFDNLQRPADARSSSSYPMRCRSIRAPSATPRRLSNLDVAGHRPHDDRRPLLDLG